MSLGQSECYVGVTEAKRHADDDVDIFLGRGGFLLCFDQNVQMSNVVCGCFSRSGCM